MPHWQDDGLSAPIDRAVLFAISNGDATTEHRLLGVFREANVMDAAALDAALEQRNGAAVMRAAHRLLGSGRMAGAITLSAICASIVQAGQADDWDAIASYRDALRRELERINAYLDKRFNDLP